MRELVVEIEPFLRTKVTVYIPGTRKVVFKGWFSMLEGGLNWDSPDDMELSYTERDELEQFVKSQMLKAEKNEK
jgi:hypothetical protein